MPKETKDKIKKTFENSISIKTDIINQRTYEVLIEIGKTIVKSISNGGKALKYRDSTFVVPSKVTGRIQESLINVGHAIFQYVEDSLLEQGWFNQR